MPIYEKIKRGVGTSPRTLTMMTSHTYKCQISVFIFAKKKNSRVERINFLYTAKQNCLQADRLEIDILVHKIIC